MPYEIQQDFEKKTANVIKQENQANVNIRYRIPFLFSVRHSCPCPMNLHGMHGFQRQVLIWEKTVIPLVKHNAPQRCTVYFINLPWRYKEIITITTNIAKLMCFLKEFCRQASACVRNAFDTCQV